VAKTDLTQQLHGLFVTAKLLVHYVAIRLSLNNLVLFSDSMSAFKVT